MKTIKYILIFIGTVTIIASITNSVYEKSIYRNIWSFALGGIIIWFALDPKLQERFWKF